MMTRHVAFFVFMAVVLVTVNTVASEDNVVWEDFEGKNLWSTVVWMNTGRGRLEVSDQNSSEGKSSLKLVMLKEKRTDRNKVGISRETYLNLTSAKTIKIDVFCESGDGLGVALGFDTGDKEAFYELPLKPLDKGWNRDIVFDLTGNNFKCETSDWKYTEPLGDKHNVRKVHILIYRPSNIVSEQVVYMDNIRVE